MKQLVTYYGLACIISWIIWLPLYSHIFGLPKLPILPFHHALGGLGPLIASFIATWIYFKTEGLKKLLRRCLQAKPLIYLLIAIFSPFLLATIASVINYIVTGSPVNLSALLTTKEFPGFNLFTFFIYNLIFFGFGEECGWRGFMLPRLQSEMNALTASILLTIFWAAWHWPLFFYRPGYTSMGMAGIAGWFFSLLTGSILLTWLYNSSRGSILVCAVFHATIDIAFTADFADRNMGNYIGFMITVWGILTIIVFKPGNLSVQQRVKLPDTKS